MYVSIYNNTILIVVTQHGFFFSPDNEKTIIWTNVDKLCANLKIQKYMVAGHQYGEIDSKMYEQKSM